MHGLCLGNEETPNTDTLFLLSRGSPGRLFFFRSWSGYSGTSTKQALLPPPPFCLFLYLRHTTFCHDPDIYPLPWGKVVTLAQITSVLLTSLESPEAEFCQDPGPVKDVLPPFIRRCGPPLRNLGIRGPLLDAAILHLMQLPNLS